MPGHYRSMSPFEAVLRSKRSDLLTKNSVLGVMLDRKW